MKITRVIGHIVSVPTHPDRVNSSEYGPAVFDQAPKIILEAHTDNGLVGLGETPRGVTEQSVRTAIKQLVNVELTQVCFQEPAINDLSGDDMFAYEHRDRPHRTLERSFGQWDDLGIHAVLLDLLGKNFEVPIYVLLGGAYRHRIKVDYWMGRMTPQDSASVCKEAQDHGFLGVKCKCTLEDDNVERAAAVRDACGIGFKITFDPNGRFYRPCEALPMLERLTEVGNVGCIENPFPTANSEWYQLLRKRVCCPIAVHMGYGQGLVQAIRSHACDFVNLSDLPWNVRKAGDLCWIAGLPTWHGSGIDLGILESLSLHVCAATKSMSRPSDILGRNIREHNLITSPFIVENGTISVPTSPGLGVQLDRDALDRYTNQQFFIDL